MDNSDEQGGEPLDANYGPEDIAPTTLKQMVRDCADFQQSFGDYIISDLARAGHDFWLTRNGHGAGFWDGDWREEYAQLGDRHPAIGMVRQYATVGDYLTAMSKPYGSFDLYVGDDGKIHGI